LRRIERLRPSAQYRAAAAGAPGAQFQGQGMPRWARCYTRYSSLDEQKRDHPTFRLAQRSVAALRMSLQIVAIRIWDKSADECCYHCLRSLRIHLFALILKLPPWVSASSPGRLQTHAGSPGTSRLW